MFLASLRQINNKISQYPSATQCELCDSPIPEKRQKLIPGVQTCVYCQDLKEAFNKNKSRTFATSSRK
ncbi:TraR/DksA C4-type zinc finger protein [Pectobacterium aroidearum]|uniref:TraR/DksA C4-type zinc finger protein n=1 Tax=Pectobacterium aroidearum TaxID=1201031 RepID=UPI00315913C2